jgi:hypothetical protein
MREYSKELKGSKLLDKDRFKWAKQAGWMADDARRRHARGFLTKGLEKKVPTRDEFTSYGQANIEMARLVFESLRACDARIFASVVPRLIRHHLRAKPIWSRASAKRKGDKGSQTTSYRSRLATVSPGGIIAQATMVNAEWRTLTRLNP